MLRLEILLAALILGLACWIASLVIAAAVGGYWFGIAVIIGAANNAYSIRVMTRMIRIIR